MLGARAWSHALLLSRGGLARPPSCARAPPCCPTWGAVPPPRAPARRLLAVAGEGGAAEAPPPEMCIIVNEENEIVGHETRYKTVSERLHGRGSYCLVFNTAGHLFISRRSESKDVYPGHFDVLVSGVCNMGEEYEDTMLRELEEELGVDASPTLEELFVFPYEDEWCKVWGCAFRCEVGGAVELQAEEVAWGEFKHLEEVQEMLEVERFTPVGLHVLKKYFARGAAAEGGEA